MTTLTERIEAEHKALNLSDRRQLDAVIDNTERFLNQLRSYRRLLAREETAARRQAPVAGRTIDNIAMDPRTTSEYNGRCGVVIDDPDRYQQAKPHERMLAGWTCDRCGATHAWDHAGAIDLITKRRTCVVCSDAEDSQVPEGIAVETDA